MTRILAFLLALTTAAFAQTGAPTKQSGNVTPSHATCWTTNGIIQDCGTAAIPYLTTIGTVGQGPTICANSGPPTGADNRLCLSSTTSSGAGITLDNLNGATGGFTIKYNGGAQGLVTVGVPTTPGDLSCFTNTTGTLQDCGIPGAGVVSGPGTSSIGSIPFWSNASGTAIASGFTFGITPEFSGAKHDCTSDDARYIIASAVTAAASGPLGLYFNQSSSCYQTTPIQFGGTAPLIGTFLGHSSGNTLTADYSGTWSTPVNPAAQFLPNIPLAPGYALSCTGCTGNGVTITAFGDNNTNGFLGTYTTSGPLGASGATFNMTTTGGHPKITTASVTGTIVAGMVLNGNERTDGIPNATVIAPYGTTCDGSPSSGAGGAGTYCLQDAGGASVNANLSVTTFSITAYPIITASAPAFTAYIVGTTLTVPGGGFLGGLITNGYSLYCAACTSAFINGTSITAFGSGSGGAGTYTVSYSQTVGSVGTPVTMYALPQAIAPLPAFIMGQPGGQQASIIREWGSVSQPAPLIRFENPIAASNHIKGMEVGNLQLDAASIARSAYQFWGWGAFGTGIGGSGIHDLIGVNAVQAGCLFNGNGYNGAYGIFDVTAQRISCGGGALQPNGNGDFVVDGRTGNSTFQIGPLHFDVADARSNTGYGFNIDSAYFICDGCTSLNHPSNSLVLGQTKSVQFRNWYSEDTGGGITGASNSDGVDIQGTDAGGVNASLLAPNCTGCDIDVLQIPAGPRFRNFGAGVGYSLYTIAKQVIDLNAAALQAAQTGTVLQSGNVDGTITRYEADSYAASAHFSGVRADGTAASPSALAANDEIVSLNAFGYGTAFVGPYGAYRCYAATTWTSTVRGTYCDVAVTSNTASSSLTESMRFENDGGITVPSTVTGGDEGPGTINVSNLYIAGVPVLTANQTITLTGDTTGSGTTAITTSTVKVHGVAYPATPSTNTVPVVTGSNTVTYEAVPVAAGGTGGGTASGTLLDNITAFASTGILDRTGAGTYTLTAPSGTIVGNTDTQTLTNKTIAFASNTLTGVAPTASPTFTGTVTGPDSSNWTSTTLGTAAAPLKQITIANNSRLFFNNSGGSQDASIIEGAGGALQINGATSGVQINTGGSFFAPSLTNSATTSALCYNTGTGAFTYDGTLGTCTVSLLSAKDLVAPLSPKDGYAIVMALQPWRYNLKKNRPTYAPGMQIGFVADYANDNALVRGAGLAATNPDGSLSGFRYENYTAALTAAFQYQNHRMVDLEKRLAELETANSKRRHR